MGKRPLDQLDEVCWQSEPSEYWHGTPQCPLFGGPFAGPEQDTRVEKHWLFQESQSSPDQAAMKCLE